MAKTERPYPKEVFWSEEDEGYIAIAPDLGGCSAFGVSEAEALCELDDAIAAWILAAKAAKNPIPSPTDRSLPPSYSGKFMTRISKSLHKDLALRAKQEGISLNALVAQFLASQCAQLERPAVISTYSGVTIVGAAVGLCSTSMTYQREIGTVIPGPPIGTLVGMLQLINESALEVEPIESGHEASTKALMRQIIPQSVMARR